jgi:hypothetical protein
MIIFRVCRLYQGLNRIVFTIIAPIVKNRLRPIESYIKVRKCRSTIYEVSALVSSCDSVGLGTIMSWPTVHLM